MCKAQKVAFIGAGKVGQTLGLYFMRHGIKVLGYYSMDSQHAAQAASRLGGICYADIDSLIESADIIMVTVSDDALKSVSRQCSQVQTDLKNKIFVHTSGVHTSRVFTDFKLRGYSLHPLQSFAEVKDHETLNLMSLEGKSSDDAAIEWLVQKAALEVFEIQADQKSQYHAAAAIASNYVTTTIDYAVSQLMAIGMTQEVALKALFPLIQGTVDNIMRLGTRDALTGPIARGDVDTINKHLKAVEDPAFYRALAKKTVSLSKQDIPVKSRLLTLLEED